MHLVVNLFTTKSSLTIVIVRQLFFQRKLSIEGNVHESDVLRYKFKQFTKFMNSVKNNIKFVKNTMSMPRIFL